MVGGTRKTRFGNPGRATPEEVNEWIATALQYINTDLGRSCWEDTMDAKFHLLRIPQHPYGLIQSFLGSRRAGEVELTSPPELTRTWNWIGARRAELNAENYVFPDKVRKADYVSYQPPWGRTDAEDVLRPIRPPPPPGPHGPARLPGEEVKEEKEEKKSNAVNGQRRAIRQGRVREEEMKRGREPERKDYIVGMIGVDFPATWENISRMNDRAVFHALFKLKLDVAGTDEDRIISLARYYRAGPPPPLPSCPPPRPASPLPIPLPLPLSLPPPPIHVPPPVSTQPPITTHSHRTIYARAARATAMR